MVHENHRIDGLLRTLRKYGVSFQQPPHTLEELEERVQRLSKSVFIPPEVFELLHAVSADAARPAAVRSAASDLQGSAQAVMQSGAERVREFEQRVLSLAGRHGIRVESRKILDILQSLIIRSHAVLGLEKKVAPLLQTFEALKKEGLLSSWEQKSNVVDHSIGKAFKERTKAAPPVVAERPRLRSEVPQKALGRLKNALAPSQPFSTQGAQSSGPVKENRDAALKAFVERGGIRQISSLSWMTSPPALRNDVRFFSHALPLEGEGHALEMLLNTSPTAGMALLNARFLEAGGRVLIGLPAPGDCLLFGSNRRTGEALFARMPAIPDLVARSAYEQKALYAWLAKGDPQDPSSTWMRSFAQMLSDGEVTPYALPFLILKGLLEASFGSQAPVYFACFCFAGDLEEGGWGMPPAQLHHLMRAANDAGISLQSLSLLRPEFQEGETLPFDIQRSQCLDPLQLDRIMQRGKEFAAELAYELTGEASHPAIHEYYVPLLMGLSQGDARHFNEILKEARSSRHTLYRESGRELHGVQRQYYEMHQGLRAMPPFGSFTLPGSLSLGSINVAGTQLLAVGSVSTRGMLP